MPGLELLVGLDVGTTSSKAVVYGLDGAALALGRAATPWSTVRGTGSSWATGTELDPHDLLNAARTAISRALAGTPEGHVVGVGVTSMAESGVLLDASGEPVAPLIAWHDTRDFDQVTRLGEEIGAEVHKLDQFFRVEEGSGEAILDGVRTAIKAGFAVVVPAGTKHNIINTGNAPLKLYTLYAPPNHRDGVVHHTRADAEADNEHFDGKTTE